MQTIEIYTSKLESGKFVVKSTRSCTRIAALVANSRFSLLRRKSQSDDQFWGPRVCVALSAHSDRWERAAARRQMRETDDLIPRLRFGSLSLSLARNNSDCFFYSQGYTLRRCVINFVAIVRGENDRVSYVKRGVEMLFCGVGGWKNESGDRLLV